MLYKGVNMARPKKNIEEQPKKKKKYEYEIVTFYFDGKQYKTTGKTLREAHAKAAKKKLELENVSATTGGNMLAKDWAFKWFDTYKSPAVGEGQHKNYKSHIITICRKSYESRNKVDRYAQVGSRSEIYSHTR